MQKYVDIHGVEIVNRVMTIAAESQIQKVIDLESPRNIALAIRARAIELFEDELLIQGMKLESDLGI